MNNNHLNIYFLDFEYKYLNKGKIDINDSIDSFGTKQLKIKAVLAN